MNETFPFAFAVLVVLVVVVAVLIAADRWQEYQAGADRVLTRSCCEEVTGELCPVIDWADLAPAVPALPDWVDDPQEYGPAFWAITDELDDRNPTLMRNLRNIDRERCIVDREENAS